MRSHRYARGAHVDFLYAGNEVTEDELRRLALIACEAAWKAHYRFGLPWPGAEDRDEHNLRVEEVMAGLRAVVPEIEEWARRENTEQW